MRSSGLRLRCWTSGSAALTGMAGRSGFTPAAAGPKVLRTFRPAVTWSSATSPTTACCALTRPPARSECSATPAGYSNGHTVDRQGRLVSCEQGPRRVTRTEPDGSITVLADRFEGKRFNSPNDVVERADGSIWFTDPSYGIDSDYEGHKAASEIGACHVYRVAPDTGQVSIVAGDFERPNGLAFSLDETQLYIVDSRARHIRLFDVTETGDALGRSRLRDLRRGDLRRDPA